MILMLIILQIRMKSSINFGIVKILKIYLSFVSKYIIMITLSFKTKKEIYLFLIKKYYFPEEVFQWDENQNLINNKYISHSLSFSSFNIKIYNKPFNNFLVNAFKIDVMIDQKWLDSEGIKENIEKYISYNLTIKYSQEELKNFYNDFYYWNEYKGKHLLTFMTNNIIIPNKTIQIHSIKEPIQSMLLSFIEIQESKDKVLYNNILYYIISYSSLYSYFNKLIQYEKEYDNQYNLYEDFLISLKQQNIKEFLLEI